MYTGIGNSGHVAKPTLKNGLIWYWDLAASASSLVDSHSRLALTRSGTVNTLTAGAPDYGSCVEFPVGAGVSMFRATNVAPLISYRDGFTANIWAMNYQLSGTGNWLFMHRGNTATTDYWQMVSLNTTFVETGTFYNSTPASFTTQFTLQPLNTWFMITMVKRAQQVDLYINAEQVSQAASFEGNLPTGNSSLGVGNSIWAVNVPQAHQGRLFAAGVWGRALKNPEIVALYNSGYGRRYENL